MDCFFLLHLEYKLVKIRAQLLCKLGTWLTIIISSCSKKCKIKSLEWIGLIVWKLTRPVLPKSKLQYRIYSDIECKLVELERRDKMHPVWMTASSFDLYMFLLEILWFGANYHVNMLVRLRFWLFSAGNRDLLAKHKSVGWSLSILKLNRC